MFTYFNLKPFKSYGRGIMKSTQTVAVRMFQLLYLRRLECHRHVSVSV